MKGRHSWYSKLRFLPYLLVATSILMPALIAASGGTGLSSQLCLYVNDIRSIVGIFALLLFVLGAILYAAANFMPSAGQVRGNMQGWSMGMLIGGIVGLILVVAAPAILGMVASFGVGIPSPNC